MKRPAATTSQVQLEIAASHLAPGQEFAYVIRNHGPDAAEVSAGYTLDLLTRAGWIRQPVQVVFAAWAKRLPVATSVRLTAQVPHGTAPGHYRIGTSLSIVSDESLSAATPDAPTLEVFAEFDVAGDSSERADSRAPIDVS